MNNIILYQTNELIFLNFYSFTGLEIFLFIQIGGEIGALNTIALVFLTAIVGIYYADYKGYKL